MDDERSKFWPFKPTGLLLRYCVFSGGHASGMKLLDGFEGAALRGCDDLKGVLFKCFFGLYFAFGFSISPQDFGD
jgi:hypothetical protein